MSKLLRLKELLPNYYDGVFDMDVLMQVEQPMLDELQMLVDQERDNHFAVIANEQGISMFETLLGITNTLGKDIETRRYDVIMRLLPPKPVTMTYLREVLAALNINASLKVDTKRFHVDVETRTVDNTALKRLIVLLKRLLPANMTYTTFNFETSSTSGQITTGTDVLYNATISNKGGTE